MFFGFNRKLSVRILVLGAGVLCLLATALPRTARAGATRNTQPEIFCEFSSDRAPIDRNHVTLFVDGYDVTDLAQIQAWRVSYVPPEPLTPGVHSVRVVVKDLAGSAGEKSWDFIVDPDAAPPSLITFVPPTPDNGATLTTGDVIVAVQTQPAGSLPDPQTLHSGLSRDGAMILGAGVWQTIDHAAVLDLPKLDPGHYALTVSAPGAREITTAFTVDTQPPQITAFEINPNHIDPGGNFSVLLTISDTPANNLSECILYFEKNGAPVAEKHVRASDGSNRIMLRARDIDQSPLGTYTVGAECVDTAGHRTASALNPRLTVAAAVSQFPNLDSTAKRNNTSFFINPLPRTVTLDRVTVRGQGPADTALLLYVNSAPAVTRQSDPSGAFHFDNVALEPGDNEIMVVAEDESGLPASETAPVTVTFEPKSDEPFAIADNTTDSPPIDDAPPDEAASDNSGITGPVGDSMIEEPVEPEPAIDDPVVEEDPSIVEPETSVPAADDPVEQPADPNLTIQTPGGADHGHADIPLHGTALPGTAVTLYLNGNAVASATANNGGQFHFQHVALAEGDNELYVTATVGGVVFHSPAVTVVRETHHSHDR